MAAAFGLRLATILCCLYVVECDSNNGDLDCAQHDTTCQLEGDSNLEDTSREVDSHVLLQSLVSSSFNDASSMHDGIARKSTGRFHAAPPQVPPETSNNWNALWTHPLVLGILLGFFLIGPDHLGTLMALSTLTNGLESFKRGFTWGFGHSLGVMLLCPIFLALERLTSKAISRESWEYYGDIFIGVSMVTVSLYFIYRQDLYVKQDSDGTYVAIGCECHGPRVPIATVSKTEENCVVCHGPAREDVCSDSCKAQAQRKSSRSPERSSSAEVIDNSTPTWLLARNSLLGVLQGLCCPLGMTAGTGFMSRVTATASTPMLVGFLLMFSLSSGAGAGLIALGWGALTTTGSRKCISGRVLYLATCGLLFLFGVAWLVAHSLGVLDQIDFGDKIHDKLVPSLMQQTVAMKSKR